MRAAYLILMLLGASISPFSTRAQLPLIAHYSFNGNGDDSTGNNAPLNSDANVIRDNVLDLTDPAIPVVAQIYVPQLSYRSFAVSVDFKPTAYGPFRSPILSCGPLYRWLDLNVVDSQLELAINNSSYSYQTTNRVELNRWHTVVASFDRDISLLSVWLDGEKVVSSLSPTLEFNVVGTDAESFEKVISFRNGAFGTRFRGLADNLNVFGRALTDQDAEAILPRLAVGFLDGRVIVLWPIAPVGYTAEFSDDATIGAWQPLDSTVQVIGDKNVFLTEPNQSRRFYRLSRK